MTEHHPALTTHDKNALTETDFAPAALIDGIVGEHCA